MTIIIKTNKSRTNKIKRKGVKSALQGHHSESTPTPQTDIHDSTVPDLYNTATTTITRGDESPGELLHKQS
jgi:hypothetical protein